VRVCLMIEGQEGVTWEQWKALASACEQSGIDTLFRSDHYLSVAGQPGRGSLDAWTTIAALAAVTSRLRLGTLVSPVTFRHPSLLAKAVVTADHVSGGGRIELGLGAGWLEAEHAAYGFPFPSPGVRMQILAEQVELVRKEWQEGPFTLEGQHYSVRELDALPKPITQPRLLLGGGGGPRSAALAARYADEYNVYHMSEDQLRAVRSSLDDACKREGRDPATLPLSLMDPVDKGPTEQVAARFRKIESIGVTRIMLQHLQHDDLETVEWIGRELAPALA
jgi:alkanesulfonate monooxygenase SsuD/methylene tetrahydromethanopterin reductase-like flavin-dependent oxidoreductase (luciferase family)